MPDVCRECEYWTAPAESVQFSLAMNVDANDKGSCCNFMAPHFNTEPDFTCDRFHTQVSLLGEK
jgi:hypothetical protein